MEKSAKGASSLAEAEKAYKKGESALKTGLFKWSPDYLGASMHFDKASKGFKEAGERQKALKAFLKLSECSEKLNENWSVGESLVQAASLESDRTKSLQYLHKA